MASDEDALSSFNRSHNFMSDFELLHSTISARPEADVFLLAIREYHFSLCALASANYRHAFISLRLFFELSLASIQFSASELKLRLWLANRSDIVWSTLIHEDNGVFGAAFMSAFQPELSNSAKQYSALAQKAYRECSEHVHGNVHTHLPNGTPTGFEKETLAEWASLADTIRLCVIFAFASRFLGSLSPENLNRLEDIFLDSLGTLPAIQAVYR
ncbi:hypothetical protein HL666_13575 [Bradyrhizobium sp. 83002]|uniref:hypothetical protein n=1 Tax=Bradyrhizobium aeschynomenes TaxID=2734909 RepID=UPI001556ED92|nr:hypothetical protein [Bradyrhizobium aeschynomenes]NPU11796.1 hypothetical protein [Bradyrhizobium aeschynomenes]